MTTRPESPDYPIVVEVRPLLLRAEHAVEADRQLQDLGVIVRFRRPPAAQGRIHRVGASGR